ncbi:MAG: hypothetical protein NVS4B6_13560 [Mycobacterium sp.]
MPVIVDCASAGRLIAEGAMCFNTDSRTATCDGVEVPVPACGATVCKPILVCGSSPDAIRAAALYLEQRGLPAWQVLDLDHPGDTARTLDACKCPAAPTCPGFGAPTACPHRSTESRRLPPSARG